jgi:hypothetical protein
MLWPKIRRVGPTCLAGWPCNLAGSQVSSLDQVWALDMLSTFFWSIEKIVFGNAPTHGRPTMVMRPAGHTMAPLSPCFVPHHFLVSYCL